MAKTKRRNNDLSSAPPASRFRGLRATVAPEQVRVEATGGAFAAGILRGVSLIAMGEALGHRLWIDGTTLEQVVELGNAEGVGVKSRFTHPGLSSDGMGKALGRIFNIERSGSRVLGDLHFLQSAHDTPDGDLAGYVMSLATEDPKFAGLSIVFDHDVGEENRFMDNHMNPEGEFVSPDPSNEKNFPHVRIAELVATDVVDEPAANPDGLFMRAAEPAVATDLCEFVIGIRDDPPVQPFNGIDPQRAKAFFTRFLANHGLSLKPESEMAKTGFNQSDESVDAGDPAETNESTDSNTDQDSQRETDTDNSGSTSTQANEEETEAEPDTETSITMGRLHRFRERFGNDNAMEFLAEGLSFEQALDRYCSKLESEIAQLNEKLSNVELGGSEPLKVGASQAGKKTLPCRPASQ